MVWMLLTTLRLKGPGSLHKGHEATFTSNLGVAAKQLACQQLHM